jgi:filamentous hemagglutinin family protein
MRLGEKRRETALAVQMPSGAPMLPAAPDAMARHRLRRSVSAIAILAGLVQAGGAARAQTLPTGGTVASGTATISSQQPATLTINQTSQRAVINWNAFSVGQGGTVTFQQPNADSATLNRVTGTTSSTIAGHIQANGQVYLINPNGILITRSGTVDTAGFTASTLDSADSDFMAGRRRYTGSGQSAGVTNQGRIRVRGGGDAVLIGGRVVNEGTISAPGGRVGLAAGESVSVDVEGDGFLTVSVPSSDPDRTRALISQTGQIRARGGRVEARAATSADVARAAIHLGGSIEAGGAAPTANGVRFGDAGIVRTPDANRVAARHGTGLDGNRRAARPTRPVGSNGVAARRSGGTVVVDGGAGGSVAVTGRVNASSTTTTGGAITVTGRAIDLSGARLDASGATGGGQIRIGGDYQGTGSLQRAETLTVDAATTIRADATIRGDGGRVILWSDQATSFAGMISAQGGALGGDGGFAEVSGKATLAFTGTADLRATHGRFGTLLLDPYNVTISNDADSSQSGFTATGDDSVINVTTLQNQLALSNVTISTGSGGTQAGDITVAAPIVWSSPTVLTLSAYRSIAVNANIFVRGAGGLAFNTNQGGTGGALSFSMGSGVNFIDATPHTGQSLSINGNAYTLIYDVNELQAINTNLSGRFALARPIDAGPTGSWDGGFGFVPLGMNSSGTVQNGGQGFTGTFEGLGNVIYNLTVRRPMDNLGLFGRVGPVGSISNVGLRNVTINGQTSTGALVGSNSGIITRSWADGRVGGLSNTGGLVGHNAGTITQSFSDAGVMARDYNSAGGLVGHNDGTLLQVYATGAVVGGQYVGGLVGTQGWSGSISQAFAIGAVGATPSSSSAGSLIGRNLGGVSITDTFYVPELSGRGSSVGTSLTLSQFLTGGPRVGFAGGTGGIMPHLASFYPNGAEMISGVAYRDLGLNPLVSGVPQPHYAKNNAYVATVIEGVEYGRVTTGANGVYMKLLPAGTLADGARILTFTNADTSTDSPGTTNAGRYTVGTGSSTLSGFDIYGNILTAQTSATLLSQASIDASGAAGSSPTGLAALAGTTGRGLIATGSSFTIDVAQSLDAQSLFVRTGSGATLTVAAAIDIRNAGKLALESGGALAINANITSYGAATVSISNGAGYDYSFGSGASMSFFNASGGIFTSLPPGFGTSYEAITQQYLTINGTKHWLIHSKFQLDEIDGRYAHQGGGAIGAYIGTGGNFALAYNIDAFHHQGAHKESLVTTFSGSFHGLGHTISNLSISTNATYAGLFGNVNGGTIRDLGITGGNITGSGSYIGSLVGSMQNGTLQNVYSYAYVSATGSGAWSGGLVGAMTTSTISSSRAYGAVAGTDNVGGLAGFMTGGLIQDSYATGNVGSTSSLYAGGLVGTSSGQVLRSFATGSVTGGVVGGLVGVLDVSGTITQSFALGGTLGTNFAGGLVGQNFGAVTQSFAAGVVVSNNTAGGLVAHNIGTIVNSYYDAQTTGAAGAGTGLTTSQLQTGGLASLGFDAAVWGGGTGGLYPYLKGFFPGGVQVVSGTAYQADGTTALASTSSGFVTVSLASGGMVRSTAATGANGYYYMLMAPGTVSGSAVAYTTANAATGVENSAIVRTATSGNISGLDIQNGWRSIAADGSLTSLSAVNAAFASAVTGTPGAAMTFNNQRVDVTASSFIVDQAVSLAGTFALTSGGPVTQTAAISAGGLLLRGGSFTLTNAGNQIGTLAADVTALNFSSAGNLTIGNIGSVGLTTAGIASSGALSVAAAGNLTIAADATVAGASPVLSAGNAFINLRGADAVTATSGRWLIYSADPAGNTFGGLDSGNTAIFGSTPATLAPTSISQTGNRYIFGATRTLTFTSRDAFKTYGDDGTTALQSRYTVTGFDPGVSGAYLADTAATAFTGAPVLTSGGTGTNANAGFAFGVSIAQGTLASASGYGFNLVSDGFLIVSQRPITVTADGQSRVYGDSNPSLTWQITSGSLVGSDSLTGGLATGATSASGVGTYAITQGSLANSNYAITYVGANLAITQRAITVTADGQSRIYGDVNPALTWQVTGGSLLSGDSLTGGLTTAADHTTGVGTYAITQGSLANANYAITYVGANLAVTQRAITVTADAQTRTYGDSNPTLSYTVGGLGLVNNDTLGSLETAAVGTSSVGTYAITQGSLANANYAITYVGANLAVTQRAITVTADGHSRTYGDSNPTLTYTVGGLGLANNDTLAGGLETAATTTSGVGSYAITQGTLGNSNYAITYVGANLAVTQRAITVTVDAQSRTYGDSNPTLSYTIGGLGLANNDTLAGGLETAATTTSGVGSYAITQGTLANSNYAITYVGANLAVTPRAITVTADGHSRTYGDANPTLSYLITAGSLVNNDTLAGGLATDATGTSNVGTYAITQGTLANGNYAITYAGANLAVTPRAITVTADAQSRIYGDANPTLSYLITAGSLVNNDTLAGGLATDATGTSNVGTYAITQGTLANGNYAITYAGANLAITQRAITVTADAQSRLYGDANPTLSYLITAGSLVNNDTLAGGLQTSATSTSGVGSYAITQGTLANGNYAITYAGANLAVTARPITITAHDLARIYGETNPELTFTVGGSGLVNGDSLTGSLAMAADVTSGVGAYAISQGTLANANYTITGFSGASLTVTARPVTITAVDVTKNFGQADPALTYILGGMGLVNGDHVTGGLTREPGEGVGSYGILQGTLAISPNYQVTFQQGLFTVNPVPTPIAIGQLATLFAPPPAPRSDAAVLDGLFAGSAYCRPQPTGGLTCP